MLARAVVVCCSLGALLAGCRGGALLYDPRDERPTNCPPDAAVVGRPGEVTVETRPLAWESREGLSYVADWVYLGIPDDLESLTLVVEQGGATTGFFSAVHEGRVLFDLHDDPDLYGEIPPFFHLPTPAAAVTFPVDEDSALPPGCLAVDPIVHGGARGETGTLHVVSRRVAPPADGVIDFDAIVVGTTRIPETSLLGAFDAVDELYAAAGAPRVGSVRIIGLFWDTAFFNPEGNALSAVRAAHVAEDQGRMNVYFVQDFKEEGTLGFAAGVPGPNGIHGTAASGVTVSVDTHLDGAGERVDVQLLAETIAHEVGHQLGLFHTSEADGGLHDALEDTPECTRARDTDGDREVSAEECWGTGGENLMFWTAADSMPQTGLSPAQIRLLSLAPVVR